MPTIERIQDVAEELDVAIELRTTLVSNLDEARRHRFQGSPTVLIDGLDIDPTRRASTDFGFGGKGHGPPAIPSEQMIRDALLEAQL